MKRSIVIGALLAVVCLASGCLTWSQGVAPVQPRYGDAVKRPAVLEWNPAKESAGETRYELAIFDRSGANVYEAADLTETTHTIATELAPGRYNWTVRPLTRNGDKWVPGPWNARKYFLFAVVFFQWGTQPYEFHVMNDPTQAASAAQQP